MAGKGKETHKGEGLMDVHNVGGFVSWGWTVGENPEAQTVL
jgi:hypothetical protein